MDLLAPWKMCLQCLPIFTSQPVLPPPSTAAPLHAASEKSKLNNGASTSTENSSENDFQEAEKPSFSDASLTHDHQHQDLPLSDYAKDVGSLIYAPAETNSVTNDDVKHVDHDINCVVFSDTVKAPQDVEFTTAGSMPPLSPITPTPIGLGYIVGQHRPLHHIHHQVNSQHYKGHSFFHSHGREKAAPLHPISDSVSNEGHTDPPLSSSQSEGDGGNEEARQHTHHQHSHKQNEYASDDGFHALSHPQSITSNVQGLQTTILPLEKSHSTPADIELAGGSHGADKDEHTAINGSSNTLEISQTGLIDGVGTTRVRRRDQLKHQFKDLRNQVKQGGHHLKEEGSKHLQNMMSAMNKQAQEVEESGSFFMVPRSHPS